MLNFKNDYSVGAHPNILNKLIETNSEIHLGYGEDDLTQQAKSILKSKIGNNAAKIFFLSGGTQANLISISFLLRVHEAVISPKSGHISSNETGAIEATGHKVIPVETINGKLNSDDIKQVLVDYSLKPHVVKPRLVYISNSTEIGTHYTKSELTELSKTCKANNLLLYLDGARLGHGLMAKNNDLTLPDIAKLTDVFYIGATKNGGLLGEALVFNTPELASEFEFSIKQKGGMLAKGRLLAIQFLELFRDDLYFELADHANCMAMQISKAIKDKGYPFFSNSETNQIFPILPLELIHNLEQKYQFYIWKPIDDHNAAIRLITSWSTKAHEVEALIEDINNFDNARKS